MFFLPSTYHSMVYHTLPKRSFSFCGLWVPQSGRAPAPHPAPLSQLGGRVGEGRREVDQRPGDVRLLPKGAATEATVDDIDPA